MSLTPPKATDPTGRKGHPFSTAERPASQLKAPSPKQVLLQELDNDAALARLRTESKLAASTLPRITEASALTPGGEVAQAQIDLSPEDLIEAPGIRFRKRTYREDPCSEEHACVEIQKALLTLKADLDTLRPSNELLQDHSYIQSLAELYGNIDVDIRETKNHQFYREFLDRLQLRRKAIYDEIDEIERTKYDKAALARLNREAIRVNRLMLKVQIKTAGLILRGRSPNSTGGNIWIHAGALLTAASNSAQLLKEESHFRVMRDQGTATIREMTTTDWGGERVWTTNLGNLDVTIEAPEDTTDGQEPKVRIRQRRWVNVHTTLTQIRRHVKRGEIATAIKKTELLQSLYRLRRILVINQYINVSKDLRVLKQAISQLTDGVVPDTGAIGNIPEQVDNLIGKIPAKNAKHWVWMDIEYKNLGAATRSQLHTIAGNRIDFGTVLQNKALIEYYAEKLRVAAEKGYLLNRNKDLIEAGTTRLAVWAGRGFVYIKQFTCEELKPALKLMNEGFGLEKNPAEAESLQKFYRGSAEWFAKTAGELDRRLEDLKRTVDGVKNRGNEIYSQFRDTDITSRANLILEAFRRGNYREALKQTGAIRGRYLECPLEEPGYIRITATLGKLESLIHQTSRHDRSEDTRKDVEHCVNLIKADVEHKLTYRVKVFDADTKRLRYVYPHPNTKLGGLLNMLGKTWIIRNGWQTKDQIRDALLVDDNARPFVVAEQKPTGTVSIPTTHPKF